MKIELSIIVPVYNVEQYLEECLDSVYAVENIKKEIILVNDRARSRARASPWSRCRPPGRPSPRRR